MKFMSRRVLVKQHDIRDCGAACLSMVCSYYGLKLPIAKYRELLKVDNDGASIYSVITGANKLNLNAEALTGTREELLIEIENKKIKFPIIARVIIDNYLEHFVVIYNITKNKIIVADPACGWVKYSYDDFFDIWTGHIITFEVTKDFKKENKLKSSFKKYYNLILKHRNILISVIIMSLIITLLSMFGTLIFQYIIDDIVPSMTQVAKEAKVNSENSNDLISLIKAFIPGIFSGLSRVCIVIIVMYLFRACLQFFRSVFLANMAKEVDKSLTLDYYNHMIELPMNFFGTRKTGEIMSRFEDASRIRDVVSTVTITIILDSALVILCGIILFFQSHILFLIALGILVIYALVTIIFRKPIKDINRLIMEDNAKVVSYLKETIDGVETVKLCNAQEIVKEKTGFLYEKLTNRNVKEVVISTIQEVLLVLITSVGTIILLWVGTKMVINEVLTVGTLMTFYSIVTYLLDPVKNLCQLQPQLQTAIVAADRLNDILELEKEKNEDIVEAKEELFNNKIEFKDVNFRYGNRDLVLNKINFQISYGDKIAIIGESGCGKTTLAKLLISFYNVESGEILFDGININKFSKEKLRKKIAYISQEIFLFSDSVRNNLLFGNKDVSEEEMIKVCKMSLVDDFVQKLPFGYDTVIQEGGDSLSGGQKQRLAIARAILRKPDILIIDEATSNLDSITEQSIKSTFDKLDITCIIIAHRLNTIKDCKKILVMDNGSIIESGTHDELIEMNGVYRKYWEKQQC